MLHVLTRALVLALLVAAGCGRSVVPRLVAGPFAPNDPMLLEQAVHVAVQRGYHPEAIDHEGGTFFVTARLELRTPITFQVRCTRDGYVLVVPHGDRVEELNDGYRIRGRVREEYLSFVAALHRGISVRVEAPESPSVPWETSF